MTDRSKAHDCQLIQSFHEKGVTAECTQGDWKGGPYDNTQIAYERFNRDHYDKVKKRDA